MTQMNLNHSKTILSQEQETEVVAGTVDMLANDVPNMHGWKEN